MGLDVVIVVLKSLIMFVVKIQNNKKHLFSRILVTSSLLFILNACGKSSSGAQTPDELELEENPVEIVDETAPKITLNGDHEITLDQSTLYVELGASATDDIDVSVSVAISGTVNSKLAGSYSITYTATDTAGNEANEVRTVIVPVDLTPPVMTLIGSPSIALGSGNVFVEPGVTATDWRDGDVDVVVTGTVDSGTSGQYNITYTATDAAGNSSTIDRVVIVDVTEPVITLVGSDPLTIEIGETYTEPGANAEDTQDGSLSVDFSGTVDDSTIGVYTVTYIATDSAGNTGSVARTVNVITDATPPVITLVGGDEIEWTQNFIYVDLGSSAYDLNDGDVDVITTGTVDNTLPGTYILTYTATDATGNESYKNRTVNVVAPTGFITTWKTDNVGVSDDNQIFIDTQSSGYDFTVNWGDSSENVNVTEDITHTYDTAGTYTVIITGNFPRLYFSSTSTSDAAKLLSVEQWGNNQWSSMERAFYGASNMVFNATDTPVLYSVSTMKRMFVEAASFNSDINNWDVSNVENMFEMFKDASSFNQPLNNWDVSKVTTMYHMFYGGTLFNQALNTWDVSNVTDMASMLRGTAFNQPLNNWNVSKVTSMDAMFYETYAFNQDVSDWDVTSVTNMGAMFLYSGLSTANYDALLNALNEQMLISNGSLSAAAYYSLTSETARQSIIETYGWTIDDEGLVPTTDTEEPTVSLYGTDMTIGIGSTFLDPGARALDDIDGSIAVSVSGDVVDENVPGTYIIIYTATDSTGNEADSKARTVIVE